MENGDISFVSAPSPDLPNGKTASVEVQTSNEKDANNSPVKDTLKRDNWASKWEYLLSLAGVAIGLGNVWRFPYICYKNGGGAFLIPYFLMTAIVGLPIFFLESSLGQFSSAGCIAIYEACPAFKGIGYTSVIVTLIASTYYSVIIAYPLVFLYESFNEVVPWSTCNNQWNTIRCSPHVIAAEGNMNSTFTQNWSPTSPAEEFFHNHILQISPGLTEPNKFVIPILGATGAVWVFIFLCIFRGVKVVGKVVWLTSTFPFMVMLALLVRGLTLPGSLSGVMYFIYPDFSKLMNFQVWSDAAAQVFFSLQVGWGSVIAMSSYNGYRSNSLKSALWIPILNCMTSILAGLVVFSVLGFMATYKNVPISDVVAAGPSLAFITYPEALANMPWAPFWSVCFFLMLFMLGIGSCFVQVQTMVASISDEFPSVRKWKTLISLFACLFIFAGSLLCCTEAGIYVTILLDRYSVAIPISVACLAEILVFAYSYGGGALVQDIQIMTNKHISHFWWICWMIFTPTSLAFILANNVMNITDLQNSYNNYEFPVWASYIGWCLAFLPVIAIPVVWLKTMSSRDGSWVERFRLSHNPSIKWGPKLDRERLLWSQSSSRKSLKKKFGHPGAVPIPFDLNKGEEKGSLFYFQLQDKC